MDSVDRSQIEKFKNTCRAYSTASAEHAPNEMELYTNLCNQFEEIQPYVKFMPPDATGALDVLFVNRRSDVALWAGRCVAPLDKWSNAGYPENRSTRKHDNIRRTPPMTSRQLSDKIGLEGSDVFRKKNNRWRNLFIANKIEGTKTAAIPLSELLPLVNEFYSRKGYKKISGNPRPNDEDDLLRMLK